MPKEIEIRIKTSFDPAGFDALKNSLSNAEIVTRTSSMGIQTALGGVGATALTTSTQVETSGNAMSSSIIGDSARIITSEKEVEAENVKVGQSYDWLAEKAYNFANSAVKVKIDTASLGSSLENVTSIQGDYAKEAQNVAEASKAGIAPVSDLGIAQAKLGVETTKSGSSALKTSSEFRMLSLSFASVIANGVQLVDIGQRMTTGQVDLTKGTFLLTMNFLQLIPAIIHLRDAHILSTIAARVHGLTLTTLSGTLVIAGMSAAAAGGSFAICFTILNALSGPTRTAAAAIMVLAGSLIAAYVAYSAFIGTLSMGTAIPIIAASAAAAIAGGAALMGAFPSKQKGGFISETGPYLLHAGEYVTPRGTSPINITVYVPEPELAGKAIVRALKDEGLV
jgi:hypothetical protein